MPVMLLWPFCAYSNLIRQGYLHEVSDHVIDVVAGTSESNI